MPDVRCPCLSGSPYGECCGSLTLDPELRWYRLDVLATSRGGMLDADATVEFRAHYKTPDAAGSQHETSRFARHSGAWVYVDGS